MPKKEETIRQEGSSVEAQNLLLNEENRKLLNEMLTNVTNIEDRQKLNEAIVYITEISLQNPEVLHLLLGDTYKLLNNEMDLQAYKNKANNIVHNPKANTREFAGNMVQFGLALGTTVMAAALGAAVVSAAVGLPFIVGASVITVMTGIAIVGLLIASVGMKLATMAEPDSDLKKPIKSDDNKHRFFSENKRTSVSQVPELQANDCNELELSSVV